MTSTRTKAEFCIGVVFALFACNACSATGKVFETGHVDSTKQNLIDGDAVTTAGTGGSSGADDRVLFRSITALAFSANGRTRSRRGGGQSQLKCVGGSASGFWWTDNYYPQLVNCKNYGWDGSSVRWLCSASLKDGLVFGDTTVICEGYDGPEDEYVYTGSCRLEYTLNFKKFELHSAHIAYGSSLIAFLLAIYALARYIMMRRFKRLSDTI